MSTKQEKMTERVHARISLSEKAMLLMIADKAHGGDKSKALRCAIKSYWKAIMRRKK